jgi:hypothetical protein
MGAGVTGHEDLLTVGTDGDGVCLKLVVAICLKLLAGGRVIGHGQIAGVSPLPVTKIREPSGLGVIAIATSRFSP